MSRWPSGSSVFLHEDGTWPELRLTECVNPGGRQSAVFGLADPPDELAKLFLPNHQPNLALLGKHLRRALGDPAAPRSGAPLVARPTLLLYDAPHASIASGFMMHRFGSDAGWMSLEEAGTDPSLSRSPDWCFRVARKLARDVDHFHRARLIVGDLSDTNIRVNRRGSVVWIDVDSFGSDACEGLPALRPVGSTPECRAPELIRNDVACATHETDRFALALQLLRLLTCQFIHPFAVARLGGGGRSIDDRIEDRESWLLDAEAYKTAGYDHAGIAQWPASLAEIACQALTADPPDRPLTERWLEVVDGVESGDLTRIPPRPVTPIPAPKPPDPEPRAPAGPGHRRKGRVIAVMLAMAIAAGIVVAQVTSNGRAPSQAGRGNATAVPTPSPSAEGGDGDATATPTPSPSESAGQRALMSVIPGTVSDCEPSRNLGRERARATCRHSGVSSIEYRLFSTRVKLKNAYRHEQKRVHVARDSGDCHAGRRGEAGWTFIDRPKVDAGRYVCDVNRRGASITWSVFSNLLLVHATRRDGNLRALYKRWQSGELE